MALWAKVQQLQGDSMRHMQSVYGAHFPIEVRHFFAQWIESQPWADIDMDNHEHDVFASQLRDNLIKMLDEKAAELSTEDMFLMKLKLQETSSQFREMYGNLPMNLVRVVKNCLATEQRLVQQTEMSDTDPTQANANRHIFQQIEFLQRCTQETEEELRQQQQKQESFIIQYQESLKINAHLQTMSNQANGETRHDNLRRLQDQKRTVEMQLSQKAQELLQLRLQLADKHHETFKQLATLQSHVLDDQLIAWKRQQQLAGNGANFEGGLETLQQWCESLAELIWHNRQQIKKVELLRAQLPIDIPTGRQDLLPMLNTMITSLLSSLVTSTFIIEKQPPQVLKKDSRFSSTIRLLVGGKLNVHMNPPTVKATIISEEQARSLLKNDKNVKNESSGDILNNTGTMEYHQANGQLAVTFRNMALKRIRRAEKKGNETVTEEKFSILFQSQFSVGGGELVFQVWTLSLPAVVTVHGNQECSALATVLWDNAFSEPSRTCIGTSGFPMLTVSTQHTLVASLGGRPWDQRQDCFSVGLTSDQQGLLHKGRVPFHVPDKVLWPQLAEALNTKFMSATGNGLSKDNLDYLASKLFGQMDDYSMQMVTWAQFNREPLPGRKAPAFWEWFYAILKLTKDWLQGPWKERLILGFISKQLAQDLLMHCPRGAFLLRFSDSEIGGITIAWVDDDPKKPGEKQVWNLAPFTDKDFKIRGLGDRVKDLQNLTTLYPDINKSQAFSRFWSQTSDSTIQNPSGYVRPDITTVIPSLMNRPAAPLIYDDPHTPQCIQPQSPASTYDTASVPPCDTPASSVHDQMEADVPNFPDFNTMDYNPEDIDQINVNELLQMQYKSDM